MPKVPLNEFVRTRRKERGYGTQGEWASALGYTVTHVSRLDTGKTPYRGLRREKMALLCRLLGISLREFKKALDSGEINPDRASATELSEWAIDEVKYLLPHSLERLLGLVAAHRLEDPELVSALYAVMIICPFPLSEKTLLSLCEDWKVTQKTS